MRTVVRCLAAWVGACLMMAASTAAAEPLTLSEVLVSVWKQHPKQGVANAGVSVAEGEALSARGGWDPQLSADGRAVVDGYYQHQVLSAQVEQATPLWGASLFAGYRYGVGDFQTYREEYETLSGGEVRGGVRVPLWKDGPIDARRAAIQRTDFGVLEAQCLRDVSRLELQTRAASVYWKWVAAGQVAQIEAGLLDVAEQREAALEELAKAGQVAPIVVVDNQRLVLERRLKLLSAEQKLKEATVALSLYLRDASGVPLLVAETRLPAGVAAPGDPSTDVPRAAFSDAERLRPELCALGREIDAAGVEVELRENQVAPAIDAKAYASRDFGDGPASLQPTELVMELSVKVPLGLRAARGKLAGAEAKRLQLQEKLRGVRDAIHAEIRTAHVRLRTSYLQWQVASEQRALAERLAEAEREKLRQGASDLVVVNLRELAAAEAARSEVVAATEYQASLAGYATARGQLLR